MSLRQRVCGVVIAVAMATLLAPAAAAEFRSIADAAVLYDAPSVQARKLYVIGQNYPVELVVVVEGWAKIRDSGGELTWVESRNLSARRTLMIKVQLADIRLSAADGAPLAFRAERNVLLDLVELTGTGWARVTHRDGLSGYIRLSQVWGA